MYQLMGMFSSLSNALHVWNRVLIRLAGTAIALGVYIWPAKMHQIVLEVVSTESAPFTAELGGLSVVAHPADTTLSVASGRVGMENASNGGRFHRSSEQCGDGDLVVGHGTTSPKPTFVHFRALAGAIADDYMETALAFLLFIPCAARNLVLKLRTIPNGTFCPSAPRSMLSMSSVTMRREMVVFNNQMVSKIEGVANTLIQRLTDAVISWLTVQLSKQKKTDFKPRNDDLSFARVNTEPCIACCEILEKARDAAKQNLSGKNLEVSLTEIGVPFHRLLLDHLRNFPVSATGGVMLAKDLKSYQDTIGTFSMPALHEQFEFIRQLGNVFLVRLEVLKSYITENYLGRIDSTLLRLCLAQRSDWGQAEKGFNDTLGTEDMGRCRDEGAERSVCDGQVEHDDDGSGGIENRRGNSRDEHACSAKRICGQFFFISTRAFGGGGSSRGDSSALVLCSLCFQPCHFQMWLI
ncbi:hypothetical protein EW146_g9713 [Bondarzewia mesenterica]|uniref:Exocyst complex component Sec10-like alpha-helical bundle domain-containing protein n=1 Tax=Bondarzewia mesenterica TaxID=1095465 RepID=A0A4S4L933_9AGAM|nr:hypothetical protein EW146_g9713 [Bondarzewia mesenterica]